MRWSIQGDILVFLMNRIAWICAVVVGMVVLKCFCSGSYAVQTFGEQFVCVCVLFLQRLCRHSVMASHMTVIGNNGTNPLSISAKCSFKKRVAIKVILPFRGWELFVLFYQQELKMYRFEKFSALTCKILCNLETCCWWSGQSCWVIMSGKLYVCQQSETGVRVSQFYTHIDLIYKDEHNHWIYTHKIQLIWVFLPLARKLSP